MNLEPLAKVLVAKGLGVFGKDIFVDSMPADVKIGVMLLGKLTGTPIDPELPGYRKTGFQLIARHPRRQDGDDLVARAVAALTLENTELTGMKVNYVRPRHEPIVFPRSPGNLLEFSVNFDACYVIRN